MLEDDTCDGEKAERGDRGGWLQFLRVVREGSLRSDIV